MDKRLRSCTVKSGMPRRDVRETAPMRVDHWCGSAKLIGFGVFDGEIFVEDGDILLARMTGRVVDSR